MYNWYSDDPDPTFIFLCTFIRGNQFHTRPPIQCEIGVVVQVIERKMTPRLKVGNRVQARSQGGGGGGGGGANLVVYIVRTNRMASSWSSEVIVCLLGCLPV